MRQQSRLQKGKDLENFVVDRLRFSGLDKRAYRQRGSGNGKNKGDIWNDLSICFECKNQRNFSPKWFEQAEREGMGTQEPIVVWHKPQTPIEASFVFMAWDYLEKLLVKSSIPPTITEPTRDAKWKGERLKQALKDFMAEMEW